MSGGGILHSLGTAEGRLLRLELVVLMSAIILGALVLHDVVHGRGTVSVLRGVMAVAYPTSYVVVAYAVGLIQDGPFHDDTFVLWATALLVIQACIMSTSEQKVVLAIPSGSGPASGGRSQYGCGDAQRKKLLLQHLLQTGLVLWLVVVVHARRRNRYYRVAIWAFLALNMLKIASKAVEIIIAHQPDVSVRVVADYMAEYIDDDDQQQPADPWTMQGYRYIFHGEEVIEPAPENILSQIAANRSVVTIDQVFQWIDQQPDSDLEKDKAKDHCLAFALFKLLKRRFYGYVPEEAGSQEARSLVLDGLIHMGTTGPDAAFRVVDVELTFLYDFLYSANTTLVGSRTHVCIAIAVAALTICAAFLGTLAPNGRRLLTGVPDIGRCITLLVVVIAAGLEVCQAVCAVPSDWSYIKALYRCVRDGRPWSGWLRHYFWWEKSITLEIRRYWEDKVDQYVFLERFNHKPWNVLSWLTLFLVKPRRQGQKRGQRKPLPPEVKRAVLLGLKQSHCRLSNGTESLRKHRLLPRVPWACRLPMVADQILAWHVATTCCDWSSSSSRVAGAAGDEHHHRLVAEKLSNYCAYLVAFVPEMLPDPSNLTDQIFDTAVQQARHHLDGCRTQSSIMAKLEAMEAAERLHVQESGTYDRAISATVIERAAVLWGQLRTTFGGDDARRWEALAEFWTEFVLFLAPSHNVDIHAEMLGAGGEFMTHLWTLLSHAGVLERPPMLPLLIG